MKEGGLPKYKKHAPIAIKEFQCVSKIYSRTLNEYCDLNVSRCQILASLRELNYRGKIVLL